MRNRLARFLVLAALGPGTTACNPFGDSGQPLPSSSWSWVCEDGSPAPDAGCSDDDSTDGAGADDGGTDDDAHQRDGDGGSADQGGS